MYAGVCHFAPRWGEVQPAHGLPAYAQPICHNRGLARLTQPFEMRVGDEQQAHLADQGRPLHTDQFILRVRGDRLNAHWPSSGSYNSPPTLEARIERRPEGLVISGTVHESFNDAVWQPGFLGLTIFMVLLAVLGVVLLITGSVAGLAPLLIGVVGGPVSFLLFRRFQQVRQPGFAQRVRELEDGMREALTRGTTERFSL